MPLPISGAWGFGPDPIMDFGTIPASSREINCDRLRQFLALRILRLDRINCCLDYALTVHRIVLGRENRGKLAEINNLMLVDPQLFGLKVTLLDLNSCSQLSQRHRTVVQYGLPRCVASSARKKSRTI